MKSKGMLAVILIVAFLAVAGGSFWLGMKYQEQSFINQMRQRFGNRVEGFQQRMPGMFGGEQPGAGRNQVGQANIVGKVDKVSGDTITMTTRMGSIKIKIPANVVVKKAGLGSLDDIKAGAKVLVEGEHDKDGNIEAREIMIISLSKN